MLLHEHCDSCTPCGLTFLLELKVRNQSCLLFYDVSKPHPASQALCILFSGSRPKVNRKPPRITIEIGIIRKGEAPSPAGI